MPFGPSLPTLLLCLLTGTALWFSRGVLDQVLIEGVAVRLALLPGWQAWVGFVALASMGAFALHHAATHPWRGTHVPRATFRPMLWPLWALALIGVPFLPWLADVWPALQVLAGPLRWIVWAVVAGQMAWVLWQERLIDVTRLSTLTITQMTLVIWLAAAAASGLAARQLTPGVIFPGGDEPHYLVIAQSLWRDGDLKIENNHIRGDYLEYFSRELAPHYQTRGVDGEIYSIHPIGMPLVIAPVYATGGYPLVVLLFLLVAAGSAALVWRAVTRWTGAPGAATFGWAAVATSTPFLVNAFAIYPEVFAGFAVATAFTLCALPGSPRRPGWQWLATGVALAALPWLSTKYAPMSAALAAVALGRIWFSTPARRLTPAPGAASATALVVGPYLVSLAGWFTFFQVIWGSPWPEASYAEAGQTSLSGLPVGVGGLLFDQEFGLLPVAPALALAGAGLVTLWRRGGEARRLALEVTAVFGAMIATVGAFHHWWGGSSIVGRNLVSVLPLLILPLAAQFAAAPAGSARRAAQHLLLWTGAAITVTLVVAQEGLLLAQGRDGSAALLEWLSPRWALWSLAPTFILHDVVTAWTRSLAWVGLAAAAAFVLTRVRPRTSGGASLAALAALAGGLAAGSLVLPLLPSDPPLTAAPLTARPRLPALDSFDAAMRPLAITYAPLSFDRAAAAVPRLALTAYPGERLDPQPLRVLHNGRLTLPAGTYEVEVTWADRDPLPVSGTAPLGVQVGRTGPAFRTVQVQPAPRGVWREPLDLAVDATFFGLLGSLDLERSIAAITVRPIRIVNAGARPRVPQVLGSTDYGETAAYFHDEQIYAEPGGFWTRGARRAVVTFAGAEGAGLGLRMHGGGRSNQVTVSARDWQTTVTLVPGVTEEFELPPHVGRVITVTFDTAEVYIPAETDATNADRRELGAWIELISWTWPSP